MPRLFARRSGGAAGAIRTAKIADRRHRLDDDRPGVDLGPGEMHRAAGEAAAGGEHTLMGLEAREGRQQGRMDVDHPVRPVLEERRRQDPHEACVADEVDAVGMQHAGEVGLEALAVGVALVRHDHGRDAGGGTCNVAVSVSRRRQPEA